VTSIISTSRGLLPLAVLCTLPACAHSSGATAEPQEPPAEAPAPAVTADDLERHPDQPIERLLAGRISGVSVRQTANGGLAVRIRGRSSLHGTSQPLYVIDGMPIEPGHDGSLHGINAYDIESIRVLKDVTDTAIYGVRGANGVVVITTKRPRR
jgi:TonB-dependent SusC/RagA subfamily outer membrane receptor